MGFACELISAGIGFIGVGADLDAQTEEVLQALVQVGGIVAGGIKMHTVRKTVKDRYDALGRGARGVDLVQIREQFHQVSTNNVVPHRQLTPNLT
ncbi:hypothetical protein MYSI104531_27355 [Mycobacterium simiae]